VLKLLSFFFFFYCTAVKKLEVPAESGCISLSPVKAVGYHPTEQLTENILKDQKKQHFKELLMRA